MIDRLLAWDEELFLAVNTGWASPLLDGLMSLASVIGESTMLIPAGLLAILLSSSGEKAKLATVFILTVALAGGVLHLTKQTFPRDRPLKHFEREVKENAGAVRAPHHKLYHRSFPSGHSQAAFTVAAFFALWYRRHRLALYSGAAVIALSRVYLGVHFPSDIIVGGLWGIFAVWLVKRMVNRVRTPLTADA